MRSVDKFPFSNLPGNARETIKQDLPLLSFSCSDSDYIYSDDRVDKADQLIVSLTVNGLIQLAELFLDIGNRHNEQNEICLENPLYGFGGADEKSIEARFWLPNSFAFYTDDIDELKC